MKRPKKSELRGILEEECNRLQELAEVYKDKISNLPKGHISIKRINNNEYAYLSFREKDKIRSTYIGKPSSEKADKMKERIEKRKEYRSKLKVVKNKIKQLQKILNRNQI